MILSIELNGFGEGCAKEKLAFASTCHLVGVWGNEHGFVKIFGSEGLVSLCFELFSRTHGGFLQYSECELP